MKKILLSILLLSLTTVAHAETFRVTTTLTTFSPVGLASSNVNSVSNQAALTITPSKSNLTLLGTPSTAVNVLLSNNNTSYSSVVVTNAEGQAAVSASKFLQAQDSNLTITANY